MNRILTISLFLILFLWAYAQNGPEIKFEQAEINYGILKKGDDGVRYFIFTNTGTAPLVIRNAKGSCGCMLTDWPKEPIMPGQKGKIKVTYDTKRVGSFTKSVILSLNTIPDVYMLKIYGEVKE